MKLPPWPTGCKAASMASAFLFLLTFAARADWQRDDTTLGWRSGSNLVWQFSFDPKAGKPFFHPVSAVGGPPLTNFKPEDHPWHYGLWFSWKYINQANYWEEDRQTGHAVGAIRWEKPVIETHKDGSATIRMNLTYTHPSGRVDMTESRELKISAPGADGSYAIDWTGRFQAGKEGALLDRTPMPNEPEGKFNGGYAGLSIRLAGAPLAPAFLCSTGRLAQFEQDRVRPGASAAACNFIDGSKAAGGLAILSDPANAGEAAPWYLVNSTMMRFMCAAILAPKPISVPPHGKLNLHYCVAVSAQAWTPESLQAAQTAWLGHSR